LVNAIKQTIDQTHLW